MSDKQGSIVHAEQCQDAVVLETTGKVSEQFPWVSVDAVASHMSLLRAHRVYIASLTLLYDQLNLSTGRLNLLWLLYRMEHRLSLSELSAFLGVRMPSAIQMVQSLEADQWLRSVKGESDRRVTFVELTDYGRERLSELLPEAFKIWEDLWVSLSSEEKALLTSLLSKLRSDLLERYIGEDGLAVYLTKESSPLQGREANESHPA